MPTIATIEDDDIDAILIAEELNGLGRLVRFKSLWEGMAAMVEQHPDAIILDLHMADSPGAEAVSLVCGLFVGVPVIVCSDDASEHAIDTSLSAGAVAHVPKAAIGGGSLPQLVSRLLDAPQLIAA